MKPSDYAKQTGACYETAWRWYQDGKFQCQHIGPRTITTEGQWRAKRTTEYTIARLEAGESEDAIS